MLPGQRCQKITDATLYTIVSKCKTGVIYVNVASFAIWPRDDYLLMNRSWRFLCRRPNGRLYINTEPLHFIQRAMFGVHLSTRWSSNSLHIIIVFSVCNTFTTDINHSQKLKSSSNIQVPDNFLAVTSPPSKHQVKLDLFLFPNQHGRLLIYLFISHCGSLCSYRMSCRICPNAHYHQLVKVQAIIPIKMGITLCPCLEWPTNVRTEQIGGL